MIFGVIDEFVENKFSGRADTDSGFVMKFECGCCAEFRPYSLLKRYAVFRLNAR